MSNAVNIEMSVDELRQEYRDNNKTIQELADSCGVSYSTMRRRLKDNGIQIRSTGTSFKRMGFTEYADRILAEYESAKLTVVGLAEKYDVGKGTMRKFLKHNDVEPNNPHSYDWYPSNDKLVEGDWLRKKYKEERTPPREIAELVGCEVNAVYKALQRRDIERFGLGVINRGENNKNWKDGERRYYGPDWPEKREKAIARDENECAVCDVSREEHKQRYGTDIEVHHIQPFASFDDRKEANKLDNLITMCKSCHKKWEGIPVVPQ